MRLFNTSVGTAGGVGGAYKVLVRGSDTTPNYLQAKVSTSYHGTGTAYPYFAQTAVTPGPGGNQALNFAPGNAPAATILAAPPAADGAWDYVSIDSRYLANAIDNVTITQNSSHKLQAAAGVGANGLKIDGPFATATYGLGPYPAPTYTPVGNVLIITDAGFESPANVSVSPSAGTGLSFISTYAYTQVTNVYYVYAH